MIRAGLGFDTHAFDPARDLVLGGVTIPDAPGLAGHSDADVLSHAVADALLGAAGLGDLGSNFPATDRWRDASSLEILAETARRLADDGWTIGNVDVTVMAEGPRLAPFVEDMRAAVSSALGIDSPSVSVKSTTTDRLGFVGRGEGLAAIAVALIEMR
ncbi:MAG: 2-C-methyl-D-erythritol 2,4-cyclodiphosphate synthase [Actinomycetota bacterium]